MENSFQQETIIQDIVKGKNVVIGSCAGSGKSRLILESSSLFPLKKKLILTYNKFLKFDTREKIKKQNIKNVMVHSFHSFCYERQRDNDINDDRLLQRGIEKIQKREAIFSFEIIYLDEAQDMTPLIYQLVKLIILKCKKEPQIIIIGDVYQTIYQYNGSSSQYMRDPNQFFQVKNPFQKRTMNFSFRITENMCTFINQNLFKGKQIIQSKIQKKNDVKIIVNRGNTIIEEIRSVIQQGYQYRDITILSYSVSQIYKFSRITRLADKLSRNNIPYAIYLSNGFSKQTDFQQGNFVKIQTFHSMKGLQNRIVFVLYFDNDYMQYGIHQEYNDGEIEQFNPLYVALTRAIDKLILIQGLKADSLPSINIRYMLYQFSFFKQNKKPKNNDNANIKPDTLKLSQHLDIQFIQDLLKENVSITQVAQSREQSQMLKSTITQKTQFFSYTMLSLSLLRNGKNFSVFVSRQLCHNDINWDDITFSGDSIQFQQIEKLRQRFDFFDQYIYKKTCNIKDNCKKQFDVQILQVFYSFIQQFVGDSYIYFGAQYEHDNIVSEVFIYDEQRIFTILYHNPGYDQFLKMALDCIIEKRANTRNYFKKGVIIDSYNLSVIYIHILGENNELIHQIQQKKQQIANQQNIEYGSYCECPVFYGNFQKEMYKYIKNQFNQYNIVMIIDFFIKEQDKIGDISWIVQDEYIERKENSDFINELIQQMEKSEVVVFMNQIQEQLIKQHIRKLKKVTFQNNFIYMHQILMNYLQQYNKQDINIENNINSLQCVLQILIQEEQNKKYNPLKNVQKISSIIK